MAAEVAFEKGGSAGPGSMRVHLLDSLHSLTEDDVLTRANLEYLKL